MIKQTGLLYEIRPTDYITGASPIVVEDINTKGDWTKYLPTGEKQYKFATFDTFSCTTFMFLNAVETAVNFLRENKQFTDEQIATLNSLGFYADGKFNCSDRFTAIMSGTMPNGNYFQNVGDSVRKDGLLPEALLTFGGNNQSEYLDKSLITEDMKAKAKQILDIIDIKYEWTTVDDFKTKLKQCPLGGAIFDGTHAVMIPVYNKYFDSYEPYLKKLPKVSYAMKVIVTVKKHTNMKIAVLTRQQSDSKQTLGTLVCTNGNNTFTCKTLELADKNNQKNISCVPKGLYKVKKTYSLKFGTVYQLQDVKNRTGIYIHHGNYFTDIQGCILVGNAFSDINKDKELDVINSRITRKALENFFGFEEFTLVIK